MNFRALNTPSTKLLMDISSPGRSGIQLPPADVPSQALPPPEFLRTDLTLPEVSELDLVRYFTTLSQSNFSVETNFYPLGSCTMKYNPKINDEIASLSGFSSIHPLQTPETVQGALEIMHSLQQMLCEVTGMAGCSLATLAGAHGELAGVLMIQAFHNAKNDNTRRVILIPDSAHGTNPASASMAGYQVETIPSNEDGDLDLDSLKYAANHNLAGLMITLPSTLGLFDRSIQEICRIVHAAGGLVYVDGANMNALLGRIKPGDLGLDIMHLNLHKTCSTPHGGGGPGAGPVCVGPHLQKFLPAPITILKDGNFSLDTPAQSIGVMGGFHGNFGVLVRAYTYLRSLGAVGLRQVSEDAVINANYIRQGLKEQFFLPYDRVCMHEAVFSAKWQRRKGIRALDIAKRLIDYGIHPPTMYFPLIVEEALMIEPTETESKETLDKFIEAMLKIAEEVDDDPLLISEAPHFTPVGRLDEAAAARRPNLRWKQSKN